VNKRNLIIQAAVAGLFSVATLSAHASGSLSNAIGNSAQIATQAVTPTSVIGSGSITYTVEGAVPIGSYYVYVQLNGGATFAAAAVSGGTITTNAMPTALNSALTYNGGTVAPTGNGIILGNGSIVAFPINVTAAMPANSTFTFKPLGVTAADGGIANATTVATPGSSLTATMSLGASASFNTGLTSIVQDEATAATAPIATFISGVNATALSSGSFTTGGPTPFSGNQTETSIINVTSGAGTALTVPTGGTSNAASQANSELLDLGGFYFKDASVDTTTTVPGTGLDSPPFAADAATTFNIANDYTGAGSSVAATVTAPAGFFGVTAVTGSGTAGGVYLNSAANCAPGSNIATGVVNAAGTTATFTGVTPLATNVPYYVCVQAEIANTHQWVTGTPSIVATLNSSTAAAATPISLAATNLYTLASNGGTVIVREYVPAAATASTGYQSFIRVINTGSVASPISFAFIDDAAGGSAAAAGTTTTAVPAGGAITLTSSQIEALTGIAKPTSANARPRVQVSASTTITVQSYLYNQAANVFTEVSGGSNGNGGNGVVNATGQ